MQNYPTPPAPPPQDASRAGLRADFDRLGAALERRDFPAARQLCRIIRRRWGAVIGFADQLGTPPGRSRP